VAQWPAYIVSTIYVMDREGWGGVNWGSVSIGIVHHGPGDWPVGTDVVVKSMCNRGYDRANDV
jgi:hypothetical protein